MAKLYVGCRRGTLERDVIRTADPSEAAHGDRYFALIGPFRTRAGADIMRTAHGPNIQTVSDAERAARRKAMGHGEAATL
jgi:hypothetical protein